jgi:DNA-binding GntR family transcriptional regulator
VSENPLEGIQLGADFPDRRITADYVADALRGAIHGGDLADGAVLNQAAIASHFGVSRVPVREAMRQLQAEGLIASEAHRLAVVRGLDLERLVELYDLRAVIEGFLVERATPNMDESRLKALRALEKKMRAEDDHAAWLELNARFHRTLYEPSGAETTLELMDQLRARGERYVRLWGRGSGGIHRPAEAGREHAEILKLVAAGDGEGARKALQQHIAHTRDTLVAHAASVAAKAANGDADEPSAGS